MEGTSLRPEADSNIYTKRSRRRVQNSNTATMGSYGRLLLVAVAMAVLSTATAAPLQEPSLQETLAYINSIHSQELSNGKLRDLYEALLRRGGEDLEDDPILQAKIIEFLQAHDLQNKADKRASYMTLCHFKICNMGRKRTLWPRN